MPLNSLLQNVIIAPKTVISIERRNFKLIDRHYKNNATLTSENGKYKYKIFMRKSNEFIEDFSIGLIWTNPNEHLSVKKSITMLRCQGPHDGKKSLGFDTHHSYHTHEITAEDIEDRRYQKPSNRENTDKFENYEQALLYFIEKCGILNMLDYMDLPSEEAQLFLEGI